MMSFIIYFATMVVILAMNWIVCETTLRAHKKAKPKNTTEIMKCADEAKETISKSSKAAKVLCVAVTIAFVVSGIIQETT